MGDVTPFDLLRPSVPRVSEQVRDARLAVCGECEHLHAGFCGICHCLLRAKSTIGPAECPIGKWGPDA